LAVLYTNVRSVDWTCTEEGTTAVASLTVATTQFQLRAETTVVRFLEHMEIAVREGVDRGAQVVVFPELASTGLLGAITDHRVTTDTISSDYWNVLSGFTDAIVHGITAMARSYRVIIVGGSHNRVAPDGSLRNTAFLAHPDGRVESQDKIHLTPRNMTSASAAATNS
jgi:predicted amidohydrolase